MKRLGILFCTLMLSISTQVFAAGYDTSVGSYEFEQPDVKISPDGKYLAMALLNEQGRSLVVVQTDTFENVGGVNFGRLQDVGNFHWVNDERLVLEVLHREEWDNNPKFYGELFTVKYNGRHGEMVYGWRAGEKQVGSKRKKRESVFGWARIVSLMPQDKDSILISSTDMPGGSELFKEKTKRNLVRTAAVDKLYSTVHKINLKTGRMSSSYTRSPEPNTTYIANDKGELVYAYGGESDETTKLYRFVNDNWVRVDIGEGQSFQPVAFSKDLADIIYLDDQGEQQACLMRQNFASKETIKLHEQCGLTDNQLATTIDNSMVYAVKGSDFQTPYEILDREDVESDFFAQIVGMFEGQEVNVSDRSVDGNYWLVKTRSEDAALGFYLYSRAKNEFTKIL